ncbi:MULTISPECIES: M48 family metalloprotease [unclassified Polynucleobacter]|uniref:M48 family metalloprotease n=1 Tax=unclassified Polynucleobacter TaxID=2640945 RepID=UPI002492B688|nr:MULTISPECIES: M48 family metalloprotease [unclassified Polynucleobacter]
MKKSIIYYILVSIVWLDLLYPLPLIAQDKVTIQNSINASKEEPPLGGRAPIILPDLGDVSAGDMSALDENKLGERIMREIRKDPDYVTNWLMYDYINQLGNELVAGARSQKISGSENSGPFAPKFEFFNVRDPSINAFALPGGYIGMHTGLMVLADNEAQLSSVLGHEIGHVTQKHIARGSGVGANSGVVILASLLLALVAARSNPSAAQGLAIGGQALAIQNQLSYSRDAEREADRIGYQILNATGFDVNGMPEFFQKLQKSAGITDSTVPAYVRTHPLTSDRIADMQDRSRNDQNKNRPTKNSIDFYLNQTMAKIEQQSQGSDLLQTKDFFKGQTYSKSNVRMMQGHFGLALVALQEVNIEKAEKQLLKSKELASQLSSNEILPKNTYVFDITNAQIAMAKKNFTLAQNISAQVIKSYPRSKAAGVLLVQAYYAGGKNSEGIAWLVQKTKVQKDDITWWNLLAKGYAEQNNQAKYHAAIAEKYVCEGALPAAIQQLNIAKQSSTGDFYSLSEIEARKNQLEFLYREELKDNGKLPKTN